MADATGAIDRGRRCRREGRLEEARAAYAEAVADAREAPSATLVEALKGLAKIERDLGRPGAAVPLYEEAALLCRISDPLGFAHTVRHLGDALRESGSAEGAESCYREALEVYRRHRETPPLDLANAIRPLAILEERAGRTEEARSLWHEARDLYAAAGVEAGYSESAARLAALPPAPRGGTG